MKRTYFFDFLIVFISVMLAFLTENWRENRQDRADYGAVLGEIESNLQSDSLELISDCITINKILDDASILIDSATSLELPRAHAMVFEATFVRWPDFDFTGLEQLKNHKSYPEDTELIKQINEYYLWVTFLKERHEFTDIRPANQLRDYLLEKGLSPPPFILTGEDSTRLKALLAERTLEILLKNVVASREQQLIFFQRVQFMCESLLRKFRGDTREVPVSTISLIGTSVGEKWDDEIYLNRVGDHQWEAKARLNDGVVRFRSNSNWLVHWGGSDFPKGTAIPYEAGILVTQGTYLIKFDPKSGEYSFEFLSDESSGN